MKHTKGKWGVTKLADCLHIVTSDRVISSVNDLSDGVNNKELALETEANARLMASAPSLYDALTELHGVTSDIPFGKLSNSEVTRLDKARDNTEKVLAEYFRGGCRYNIWSADHYRKDGSCKCSNKEHRGMMMEYWGYSPPDFIGIPLVD